MKLLVFDWDGTLMDSAARIVDCMRSAISDVGETLPTDEAIRDIIGLGLREAIEALMPDTPGALRERIALRYRQHFLVENDTPSTLFSGVEATLHRLQGEGYLLAVATGKGRRGLDQALESTGLRTLFHATRCADETFSKPHPEMLLQLMEDLGASPGETLMIGDTEYDMQMAANAGTWALGVSYGVHPCERLGRHRPLDCINSVTDIPERLAQWADGKLTSGAGM